MAKYMILANYSVEGAKGVLKGGGMARRDALQKLVDGLGGRLEAFYFMFGEDDVVLIVDLPDNTAMAAASLTVAASGAATAKTIVLLTPEEIDDAAKKSVSYTPPGG